MMKALFLMKKFKQKSHLKQSKRSIVPKVTEPIGFEEVLQKVDELDLFLVPYENANNFGIKTLINKLRNEEKINNIKNIGIFVGPEC